MLKLLPFRSLLILCLIIPIFAAFGEDTDSHHDSHDDVYKAQNIAGLEALEGKVIRTIEIEIRDVFEEPVKNSFYKDINKLKINTQKDVVRRELLFKEGDIFDTFPFKESERNLRAQRFLRNISITPIADGNYVDIKVSVQDTWTFIPSLNYSSGAGSNDKSIGLSESNIDGLGKRVEILLADQAQRRTMEGVYEDPRLLGSSLRFVGADFYRADGNRSVLLLTDPFRTLLDKESWSVDSDVSDTVGKLWQNGEERYIYRQKTTDLGAKYAWSFGNSEKNIRRYSLGYDYQENTFKEASPQDYDDVNVDPAVVPNDPSMLAANRRYTGPSFGFQSLHPRFISKDYIDRFDRVDDYDIGSNFSALGTVAPQFLGSIDNAFLASLNESAGRQFDSNSFIRGEFGFSSRISNDKMENALFRAESKYYDVLGPLYANKLFLGKHTFAFGYSLDYGRDLDKDREFLLGADNGLRGYSTRTFTGDKRLIINAEDRVHIADDVFKLISFGAAAFVDIGGTTEGPLVNVLQKDLYGDAGVGLRFAFPRSSGGKILRIDFAVPFRDAPDGSNGYEVRVIFAGGQIFGSRLRSEVLGAEKANVEVGTDK